jgi:hypothetical protein
MRPVSQQLAPYIYGVIQAAITTAVATAIAIHQLTDLGFLFLRQWLWAWSVGWLTMLPIVIFVAPFIQRFVIALTQANGTAR